MKLCLSEDEGMLCDAARRHLGEPAAVAFDRDVTTGATRLRAADRDDDGACLLDPVQRFGYAWSFDLDDPPLEPGGYRLHPNRDGTLTVDLTPCPT